MRKLLQNQAQLLLWFFVIVSSYCIYSFFARAVVTLAYPYEINYTESAVLNFMYLLHSKGTYFLPIDSFPLVHAAYPPLFPTAALLLGSVFGETFFTVRIIAIVATCLCAIILSKTLFQLTKNIPLAFLSAALFLGCWHVQHFGTLAKVDTLALVFSLLSLYAALFSKSTLNVVVLMVLTLLTKQSFFAANCAIILWLWIVDERRKVKLTTLAIGACTLSFVALEYWSNGQAYLHLVTYTATVPFYPARIIQSIAPFFISSFGLLFLSLVGVCTLKKIHFDKEGILLILYLLMSCWQLLATAKEGADSNYFLEPFAALLLVGLYSFDKLKQHSPVLNSYAMPELCILLAVCALFGFKAPLLPEYVMDRKLGAPEEKIISEIQSDTANNNNSTNNKALHILSENVGMLLMMHQEVLSADHFQFIHLAKQGLWNPEKLLQLCEQQQLDYVISETRLLRIPGMQGCLERRYRELTKVGGYKVWKVVERNAAP